MFNRRIFVSALCVLPLFGLFKSGSSELELAFSSQIEGCTSLNATLYYCIHDSLHDALCIKTIKLIDLPKLNLVVDQEEKKASAVIPTLKQV